MKLESLTGKPYIWGIRNTFEWFPVSQNFLNQPIDHGMFHCFSYPHQIPIKSPWKLSQCFKPLAIWSVGPRTLRLLCGLWPCHGSRVAGGVPVPPINPRPGQDGAAGHGGIKIRISSGCFCWDMCIIYYNLIISYYIYRLISNQLYIIQSIIYIYIYIYTVCNQEYGMGTFLALEHQPETMDTWPNMTQQRAGPWMGLCGAGTKVVGLSQSLTLILFFNFGLCWSCDQGSDACSLDFTCSGSLSYKSSVPGLVVFNGITKNHPQIFTVLFVFFGSMVPKIGVPPNPPN